MAKYTCVQCVCVCVCVCLMEVAKRQLSRETQVVSSIIIFDYQFESV